MAPRARPPPARAAEPTLGLQHSRVLLSLCMYVAAAAALYQKVANNGMVELVGSHVRARAPWVRACGQLEAKEFVLAADRVVRHNGVVAPGIGESLLHASVATLAPLLPRCRRRCCLLAGRSQAPPACPRLASTPAAPPRCPARSRTAVHVRGGLIAGVYSGRDRLEVARMLLKRTRALPLLDYGDAVIAPGLIDVHVHMNEPGREEWEGERPGSGRAVLCGRPAGLLGVLPK